MIDLLDFIGVMVGLEAVGVVCLIAVLVLAVVALVYGSMMLAAAGALVALALVVYGAGKRQKAGRNPGDI